MSDAMAFEWYDDLGPIDAGGWGAVRKMRRIRDGVLLAMKRILPKHRGSGEMRDRFAQEERVLRALQGHPNIVRLVQSHGEMNDGQGPGLALELLEGNLLRRMRRGMSYEERIKAALEVANALEFMHGRGVIHRDVKPENVLLDKQGVSKLADFGCAKAPGFGVDMTNWSVGTRCYMAPEQHRPQCHADERSDVHAYGVTVFHVFLGRLPAFNDRHQILQFPGWEDVHPQFLTFLVKATAEAPDDRHQSMAAVKAELLTLHASGILPGADRPQVVTLDAAPVSEEVPGGAPAGGPGWQLLVAAVVVGLLVIGGAVALRKVARAA